MIDSPQAPTPLSRHILLSTCWVFVLINMIYADIMGMLKPGYLDMLDTVSQELSPGMVLTFSLLLEVPIIMILLSRILDRRLNRLANFIAIPISILFVVYGGLTDPPVSYLFFGGIEIIAMLAIGWSAWSWPAENA